MCLSYILVKALSSHSIQLVLDTNPFTIARHSVYYTIRNMTRDIVDVFPLEIWERCIATACDGHQYAANLLLFTSVSQKWCHLLINIIDEDTRERCRRRRAGHCTIALFLHLSCDAQLSLQVCTPLSTKWNVISPMLLACRARIRRIVLDTAIEPHSPECDLKNAISDHELQCDLQYIFKSLRFPSAIEDLDLNLDRPCDIASNWLPPNLLSSGNWLVSLELLKSNSSLFTTLRHLSIHANYLVDLLPYIQTFESLQSLHLYSDEDDYSLSPPPPKTAPASAHLPQLRTLRYQGRIYWASKWLLNAVSYTIQHLELKFGILDLGAALHSLEACQALHHFSLVLLLLDYDIDSDNKRRIYSQMNITNFISRMKLLRWRSKQPLDFRCELRPFGSRIVPKGLDLDQLWQIFHSAFPRMRTLAWNLPIQSDSILVSLVRQKELRRFESNVAIPPSTRQGTGLALSTLQYLKVEDAGMFRGIIVANLLHISATCHRAFRIPAGFTFALLNSMDLKVADGTESPCELSSGDFPVLEVLAITFLGPREHFQLNDLPSLRQISISTSRPTFTQGMRFCASLIRDPWKCPLLEQIDLDSFLECDILYLMLRSRNYLPPQAEISRIKRLRVSFLPPAFRPVVALLLGGIQQDTLPQSDSWSFLANLSIQNTQPMLLDDKRSVTILYCPSQC